MKKKYDVFISYRRNGGEATAKMIYDKLRHLGYRVFFDVVSLRNGLFNENLHSVIEQCTDIVVILSAGALDRCDSKDDWVRREIEHALQKRKNVVPILHPGFKFPEKLPDSIEKLRYMQSLDENIEYFDAFANKLQSFLLSKPSPLMLSKKFVIVCAPVLAVLVILLEIFNFISGSSDPPDPTKASTEQPVRKNADNSSETKTSETVDSEDDKEWLGNTLRAEVTKDVSEDTGVLGSDIARKEIFTVTFLNSLEDMPDDAWDVSEKQNKKVMAWIVARDEGYDLYIGGKGGIEANKDSSHLFDAYVNVERIQTNGNFHTENVKNMYTMFYNCVNLTELDVSGFDTSNVTDMGFMFYSCWFTKLDVSRFDTSNVKNMGAMFYGCEKLAELDVSRFDTSNVKDMGYMFAECRNLKNLNVTNFKTVNVEKMNAMFNRCESLAELDVSKFDTSNVTDMAYMFAECRNLENLNVTNFKTAKVEGMKLMFYKCESLAELDVSKFDTSNVTDMYAMFYECSNITKLDVSNFKTSNVENMSFMFGNCKNLKSLDVNDFDTSNVTEATNMFLGCDNLPEPDVSNFAPELVKNMGFTM